MAITYSTTDNGSNVYEFNENQENNKILEKMRNQRSEGKFCDIMLHVAGVKLPAHRSVLAASSPYFESILKNHRVVKEEIVIKWHNVDSIQMVLDYMYSGKVTISESNVEELIKLANQFLISKLKGYCEQFIMKVTTKENCMIYKDLAEKYDLASLREEINQFIAHNNPTVTSEGTVDAPATRASKRRSQTTPTVVPVSKRPATRATASTQQQQQQQPQAPPQAQPQQTEESPETHRSSRRTRAKPPSKFASGEWVTGEKISTSPQKNVIRDETTAAVEKVKSISSDDAKPETTVKQEDSMSQDEDDSNLDDSVIDATQESEACIRLEKHVKDAGSASPSQWKDGIKCPHCSYIGHSATRLEQHLSRVHGEDQTYKCKVCNFECKWNREFYKHMKDHFDGPPYKCEDCDYSCDRIQFILSHRMRHTDERPFQCELCNFSSRTRGNLVVHMRIHTGEKPYRCQHCGRCFAMKNTLDQHMATHRDDRPFLCDTCGFTTKYQSHLLSHKRIHSGNVFHCDQPNCGYFSPRRSQLAAHLRSHMSIRSHICSTCKYIAPIALCALTITTDGEVKDTPLIKLATSVTNFFLFLSHSPGGRGFIEKSHLIRHERIHLSEKPFKCENCDYGSTRRDKLKEHVAKHHGAEGAPKTPYKPRKTKPIARNNSTSLANIEELPAHQVIIPVDTNEEEIAAAANIICYEYVIQSVDESGVAVTFENSKEENITAGGDTSGDADSLSC